MTARFLSLILLTPFFACSSAPKTKEINWDQADDYVQNPIVYKASKGDQLVYLVGTAHSQVKDLPENLKKAILASEVFVSEGTLIDTDTPPPVRIAFPGDDYKVSPEALAAASESLNAGQSQDALKKLSGYELWLKVDENVRAWEQVNEEFRSPRSEQAPSVSGSEFFDTRLEQFAKETGANVFDLETYADETLQRCEELTAVVFLERLALQHGYQKDPKVLEHATATMDDACIQKRNLSWMHSIDTQLLAHKRLFIAVGLAHLVLKEPNLITLFKERGFSAEIVPNPVLPAPTPSAATPAQP